MAPDAFNNQQTKVYRIGDSLQVRPITEINKQDLVSTRKEYYFEAPGFIQRWLLPLMRDERDVPMLHLMFNICIVLLPCTVGLYLLPSDWYAVGIVNLVFFYAVFMQRFILWLHFSSHLKTYVDNTAVGWLLNRIPQFLLAPFFGIPPGCYYLHHVVMHHCENNLFPYDVSSTEPYNRGNFLHFLFYWARYVVALWLELPYYAFIKRRYRLMALAVLSKASYVFLLYFVLNPINPMATFCLFTLPFFVTSFLLMFGNFSQHMFVDPKDSRNNYKLTMNVINCDDNPRSFNDGYHILHHLNGKIHWTQLPHKFAQLIDTHAANDAFIFDGLGFFDVGLYVFTKRFDKLADCMIQLGDARRSKDELIRLIKSRLQPIHNGKS